MSYLYLGHCFAKKKLLDLAVQQYTSCLDMMDDDMSAEAKEVRYSRARVYEALGKTAEASTDYTRLVELDLGFKDAATRLSGLKSQGDKYPSNFPWSLWLSARVPPLQSNGGTRALEGVARRLRRS